MQSNNTRRRTVLKTFASLGIGVLLTPTTVAAGDEDAPGRCEGVSRRESPANSEALSKRPETYVAVVDRIVDEQFVVLLLEENDEPIDQLTVPTQELPPVEEGDVLLVTLEDDAVDETWVLVGETERRRRWSEDRIECLAEQ